LDGTSGYGYLQKVAEELIREAEIAHGVIIMPSTKSLEIIETYNRKNKPTVHINPPTLSATANFVSTDYFDIGRKVGNTWKQTGRKRVLFLSSGVEAPVSTGLLLAGFVNGLGSTLGSGLELHCEELADTEEPEAASDKRMQEALHLSWTPDAILSASDRMALSAYRVCRKANLSIPEDISIIGASGLDLSFSIQPGLTRAQPAFRKLGQKVLEMLLSRIQSNNTPVPGVFLPATFCGGKTTRASENHLLHISAAHAS
jgi:DNA-binding LacI/PurR family transcriptional regulator